MPQAKAATKPVAKPVAEQKPATKPAVKPATKPVAKPATKKVLKSGDTFKVKNTSNRILCLSKGNIEIDKVGLATVAEYSTLSAFMEKV